MDVKILKGNSETLKELATKLGLRAKMEKSDVIGVVSDIIENVKTKGDEALYEYTGRFDKVDLTTSGLKVDLAEIDAAYERLDSKLRITMEKAAANILEFHKAQIPGNIRMERPAGSYVELLSRPLETVGVYVPGGTAVLPSSVLMNVLPAKAAGVRRIVMCTPPDRDGNVCDAILAAAKIAGADEVFKVGGAQAVAAMAYGTASIPAVDKICGPGNIYVNTAKRLLYGTVDIDMFAGPSEILVIADKTARPEFLAADMLSQAEHDVLASAILLTDSEKIATNTRDEILSRARVMPRREILERSISDYCAIVLLEDTEQSVLFANLLAPEHLELCVANADMYIDRIRNAGAVFVGNYSPEPLGDYFAGPNHVLPTSGTAKFFSPLNTGDFIKKISVINYTREGLQECYKEVADFAKAEGLLCHAQSMVVRFDE